MVILFFWTLTTFVLLQRLLELHLANRNRQISLASGAQEYGASHYPLIVLLHVFWFVGWLYEALVYGPNLNPLWIFFSSLFVIAQGLRYWAIISLGIAWNTRILIIPGAPPIKRGPYRFIAHPNYLAVAIELFCLPMIFGAWITASMATLFNAIILLRIRIPTERRALNFLQIQSNEKVRK